MKKLKSKPAKKALKAKKILLLVSGSIAAYRVPDLVRQLRQEGAEVTCVMTRGAQEFVTPLTLRAVSGNQVFSDFFDPKTPHDVLHTALAESADLVIVAPASANFLARVAAGMADDLASCIILATPHPVLLIPAMNDRMFLNPITQRNLKLLRETGYRILSPVEGDLVCGRTAIGHIPDPQMIIESAVQCLNG